MGYCQGEHDHMKIIHYRKNFSDHPMKDNQLSLIMVYYSVSDTGILRKRKS